MTGITLDHEALRPAQPRQDRRAADASSPRTAAWDRLLERMGGAFLSSLAVHTPLSEMQEQLKV